MGQTKEVTTIRFYMKDSFEEHIMDIQKTKKDLADLLLSRNHDSESDSNVRRLQYLRSLL